MGFFERLADRIGAVDSVVCVGLDPHPDRLPGAVDDADLPRWADFRDDRRGVWRYAPALPFDEGVTRHRRGSTRR